MFPKKTTFLLFLTVFIDMMGFSIIFPVFPEILKFFQEKGQDPTLQLFQFVLLSFLKDPQHPYYIVLLGGLTGSLYAFLQFLFAPFWGKLSDRVGRKPILILTSCGNLLGYIIWLFSNSFDLFVLSRIITGSMGGNISVASAAIADVTPKEKRASGMGIIGAGVGLGFLFGPPLGGVLAHLPNFLPTYEQFTIFSNSALLAVLVALLNLLLIVFFFKETHTSRNQTQFTHPVFFLFQSSNREVFFISLVYFLFSLGFSGMEFSINFFFHDILEFSPRQIGFSFVYMGLIVIFVQGGIVRKISGKVTEKKIAIFGSILLVIGFSILGVSKTVVFTFLSLSFLALGSGLLNPSLSSLVSLVTQEDQGKALGMFRGLGSLARALSPIIFSVLYFQFGPSFGFFTSGVLSGIVFILLFFLPRKENSYVKIR